MLLASFFLAPAPPAPADNPNLAVNINYVFGLSYEKPQTWMPPMVWLLAMIVGFPLVFYVPSHLVFRSVLQPGAWSRMDSKRSLRILGQV